MSARGPHAGQPLVSAGPPLGSSPVMIMVHGRNASARNILDLCDALNRPAFTYLAPSAAGNTWYPNGFMSEIASNEPFLSSALSVLEQTLDDVIAAGVLREQIMLLGFSQGACLSGEFAVRHAGPLGGLILYSGGLIGPAGTTWNQAGDFAGAAVFLGCSDIDPHIPEQRVEESAAVFERMGATVTKRIYAGMGHTVNADELRFTQALMDGVLVRARS